MSAASADPVDANIKWLEKSDTLLGDSVKSLTASVETNAEAVGLRKARHPLIVTVIGILAILGARSDVLHGVRQRRQRRGDRVRRHRRERRRLDRGAGLRSGVGPSTAHGGGLEAVRPADRPQALHPARRGRPPEDAAEHLGRRQDLDERRQRDREDLRATAALRRAVRTREGVVGRAGEVLRHDLARLVLGRQHGRLRCRRLQYRDRRVQRRVGIHHLVVVEFGGFSSGGGSGGGGASGGGGGGGGGGGI